MVGRGAIAPYLDVNVESEAWLKTWAEYVMRVNKLPADALEHKALNLRIRLLKQFKAIRLQRGQAKRELKARGGRIKIRKSIRDKYKSGTFLGGLYNRASKARVKVRKRIKKTGETKTISRFAWADAVAKEISARNRSRSLLAASWVNEAHKKATSLRTANFRSDLKSTQQGNSVSINTYGNNPRIVLENYVAAVSKVGNGKGILARALRAETDDMKKYLADKAARVAKRLEGGAK